MEWDGSGRGRAPSKQEPYIVMWGKNITIIAIVIIVIGSNRDTTSHANNHTKSPTQNYKFYS